MNTDLQIFLIISILLFLAVIIKFLTKKSLNLKYTLTWLFSGFFMLIISIFPEIIDFVGAIVGIVAPVNTVFLFAGMFSLLIIFTLTIIVSHMNNKIYRMVQVQAMLEKRIRDLENNNKNAQEISP